MKPKPRSKAKSPAPSKGVNKASAETNKRRLTLAFIAAIFGFLIYSNTFSHGYVLDDFSAVKENNIVRQGVEAIPEIFKTSYRQGYLSVKDGLYRPLSLAMFAIEWEYFPDQPGVSHFVNVVLYALTGFLLFFLLCCLTPSPSPGGEGSKRIELFAFIATMLFMAHPLHVEVVANIKSRDEILCFLFVVCSFLAVFRFVETGKKKFIGYGIAAFVLSFLSKETTITFLALLPLALHFFTNTTLRKNLSITAVFVVTAAIYLSIRTKILDGAMADDSVSIADNLMTGAKTFSTHMGTAFYIMGLYIKLLFFPHPLSYDYSFNHIPIVEMTNVFSILSFLFYLAIGGYAALILWRSFKAKAEAQGQSWVYLTAFGVFFFLITIFLFSNLVLIIGTSMGDRLMYFPSLGFCICIAVLSIKFLRVDNLRLGLRLAPLIIIALLFSFKTWSRNADWKDNYTLYAHDVTIVPNSVKAHYYLGLELVKVVADAEQDTEKKKKIYEEGIAELEKAVSILPAFASAYTQMGVAYYRLKNYEKAIENYNKAASLSPSDAIALNNIGTVYFEWKKYPEAQEKFRQAISVDVRFVDAHMNLGSVLGTMGDFKGAIAGFENAIRYAPDNARAYFFIGLTYSNMGDKVNADKYFTIAERMDPKMKRP